MARHTLEDAWRRRDEMWLSNTLHKILEEEA